MLVLSAEVQWSNSRPLHCLRNSGEIGSLFGGLSCTGVFGSNLPDIVIIEGRFELKLKANVSGSFGECIWQICVELFKSLQDKMSWECHASAAAG